MTGNISTSRETAANDARPEDAKVAPAADPPAVDTEKKAEDTPPLKS